MGLLISSLRVLSFPARTEHAFTARMPFGVTAMELLDIFALLVLLTLAATVVGAALVLGWLPGHLAAKRGHPQAAAIRICGWLGLITLGILLPIAFIWAFLRPLRVGVSTATDAGKTDSQANGADIAAELRALNSRLSAIEAAMRGEASGTKAG